jgi:chromosome segregation ATPase
MSVQSVGSNSSLWQTWQTMKNDLKTFSQDLTSFQTTQKSGTQDQIQTSQNAVQQAMTSLLNDITNVQGVASGTSAAATNNSSEGQATTPLQSLSQDLTNFQTALNSGNQGQIQNLEATLQNDISAVRSHHHHHHHHATGSNASQTTNPLQTLSQDLTNFQTALNSGTSTQDQLQSLVSTLQNDISAFSQQQSTASSSVNLTV